MRAPRLIATLLALAIAGGCGSELAAGEVETGATAGSAGHPLASLDMLPPFEAEAATGRLTLLGDIATVGLAEHLAGRLVEAGPVLGAEARSFATTQEPNWWELGGQAVAVLLAQPMDEARLAEFEKTMDYKPTQLRIALDPLVVVVHRDNPIAGRGLTFPELSGIFGPPKV